MNNDAYYPMWFVTEDYRGLIALRCFFFAILSIYLVYTLQSIVLSDRSVILY